MRKFQYCVALGIALNASRTVANLNQNNCPLLGPAFPQPRGVDVEAFRPYADEVTRTIEDTLAGRGNPDWLVTNTSSSFSVALWTTSSNESLYEHHFEGSEIRGDGHEFLNNDTLYRIGSISKVFPVYAWLAAIGEAHLDEPITKFVPELAELDHQRGENATSNDVDDIRWSDVTPRSLASQMSGIPRDCESSARLSRVYTDVLQTVWVIMRVSVRAMKNWQDMVFLLWTRSLCPNAPLSRLAKTTSVRARNSFRPFNRGTPPLTHTAHQHTAIQHLAFWLGHWKPLSMTVASSTKSCKTVLSRLST